MAERPRVALSVFPEIAGVGNAMIGVPLVLTNTAIIYWVFRARVASGDKRR